MSTENLEALVNLLMKTCGVLFALFIAINIILWVVPDRARDDSDSLTERSGMMVLTDHLTGCQYLYRGSITPRMDAGGKQLCTR
jgi:hypothetical protein